MNAHPLTAAPSMAPATSSEQTLPITLHVNGVPYELVVPVRRLLSDACATTSA